MAAPLEVPLHEDRASRQREGSGMTRHALVLGSGGLTGIAWESGVLRRLEEDGIDPTFWDVVIGSSAGSFVGVCHLSGRLAELYESQFADDAAGLEHGLARAMDNRLLDVLRLGRRRGLHGLPQAWAMTAGLGALARYALLRGPRAARDVLPGLRALALRRLEREADVARLGELIITVHPRDNLRWVEHWESVLGPASQWPPGRLVVTAVDLGSGTHVGLERSSGITLARAVAASTAIPLVVNPVTIGGRRCGDGGVGSTTNVGFAAGYEHVLILAPLDRGTLAREAESLGAQGSDVVVIQPGTSAAALGTALTTLDPRRRAASARAGYDDGAHLADRLRSPGPGRRRTGVSPYASGDLWSKWATPARQ